MLVESFECEVRPVYRLREDGKPGREIVLKFADRKLFNKAEVELRVDGKTEVTHIPPLAGGRSDFSVLLPDGVGVEKDARVALELRQGKKVLKNYFLLLRKQLKNQAIFFLV